MTIKVISMVLIMVNKEDKIIGYKLKVYCKDCVYFYDVLGNEECNRKGNYYYEDTPIGRIYSRSVYYFNCFNDCNKFEQKLIKQKRWWQIWK